MEFQFDDRSQASIAFAEIGNPACQINRCASGKSSITLQSLQEAQPSAWKDSLPQLQSGYFPEEGLLWEKSRRGIELQLLFRRQLCEHRISSTFVSGVSDWSLRIQYPRVDWGISFC